MGAFLIAIFCYANGAVLLSKNFAILNQWQMPLSFLVIFIVSYLLFSVVVISLTNTLSRAAKQSMVNQIAGIAPGFLTGIIAVCIVSKLLSASLLLNTKEDVRNSKAATILNKQTAFFDTQLNSIFGSGIEEKISGAYEAGPGINHSEEFECSSFLPRPNLEEQLLQLVNEERKKIGLQFFIADTQMQKAAKCHAIDMFTRGYFSHSTPEGKDPFDRMKDLAISFQFAGENLAHSSSLVSAHNGLMQSPGHRKNILNPSFGKIGICVLDGRSKGLMIVQEFRD